MRTLSTPEYALSPKDPQETLRSEEVVQIAARLEAAITTAGPNAVGRIGEVTEDAEVARALLEEFRDLGWACVLETVHLEALPPRSATSSQGSHPGWKASTRYWVAVDLDRTRRRLNKTETTWDLCLSFLEFLGLVR